MGKIGASARGQRGHLLCWWCGQSEKEGRGELRDSKDLKGKYIPWRKKIQKCTSAQIQLPCKRNHRVYAKSQNERGMRREKEKHTNTYVNRKIITNTSRNTNFMWEKSWSKHEGGRGHVPLLKMGRERENKV